MARLLVLTPLALELGHLKDALKARGLEGALDVGLGGHGKVEFALSTQLLIQKFSPSLVVCAGAAGSLNASVRPLDVVVGETTVEHDFKLQFVKRPLPRFSGDPKALAQLRQSNSSSGYVRHFAALASGDEDVLDPARGAEIARATGALAVAWEGAGAARACMLHKIPFLEVRVITDSANARAPQDFRENVRLGMRHVAETLSFLI